MPPTVANNGLLGLLALWSLYFNASNAASVFGQNEEVSVSGCPAPSEPVLSLTDGFVIVSRENFRVVSRWSPDRFPGLQTIVAI
jgi:hypothetical protein